jgi:multiple sugar transport system permease protein
VRRRVVPRGGVQRRQEIWGWIFIAIPLLYFAAVRIVPTMWTVALSFRSVPLAGGGGDWIGFANYRYIFLSSPPLLMVLRTTLWYLVLGLPTSLLLSFIVAYYLDQVRRGQWFLRTLYFVPYVSTAAIMAWVWRWIYLKDQNAPFNAVRAQIFGGKAIDLFRSWGPASGHLVDWGRLPAVVATTVPAVWALIGFQVLIFLAGFAAIPRSLYEAAEIDGAGRSRVLFRVTIPLLRPTLSFLLVISSIYFIRIFDQVINIHAPPGEPGSRSLPLVGLIVDKGFPQGRLGMFANQGVAAALTVVLLVTLVVVTFLMRRGARTR